MEDLAPRPGDLEAIETASRDEMSALQLERMKWSLTHAYENSPILPARVRRGRRPSGRPEDAGGSGEVPLHHQEGSARHLSLRHVRRAARKAGAHSRLVRDDRQADSGWLYAEGYRHLGNDGRALDPRLRRTAGRYLPISPMATGSSPAALARITARKSWAAPSCRFPAG